MYCSIAKNPRIPLFSNRLHSTSKLLSFSNGSSQIGAGFTGRAETSDFSVSFCRRRRPSCNFDGFPESRYFFRSLSLKRFTNGSRTHNRSLVKFNNSSLGSKLSALENTCGVGTRCFSVESCQKSRISNGEDGGKRLPWISAAYSGKKVKKVEKRVFPKTSKSSWEESARKLLSKNESKPVAENISNGDRGGNSESLESENRNHDRTYKFKDEDNNEEDEEEDEPVDDPRWVKIKKNYSRFVEQETRHERPEVANWKKQENWGKKTWREATESSVPKMVGEGIYGVGPVLAALTVGRREFYALYVQEALGLSGNNKKKKKDKKGVESIFKMAEEMGLTVKETSKHDLNMIVDNRPHQGLVLDASPLDMVAIKELDPISVGEGEKAPVWVALDEVTDPQNLGAILRSSYFFGVKGVIVCAKNSAPLSGVVSKASAGALELIELRSCKNMMQFLTSSAENGWRVLGGSVSSKAVPLNEVESGVPTILVLGSEGSGLRPLVERSCTHLIRIPGNVQMKMHTEEEQEDDEVKSDESNGTTNSGEEFRSFLAVESLNVSVATGVLLYHLVGNNSHGVAEKQLAVNNA